MLYFNARTPHQGKNISTPNIMIGDSVQILEAKMCRLDLIRKNFERLFQLTN